MSGGLPPVTARQLREALLGSTEPQSWLSRLHGEEDALGAVVRWRPPDPLDPVCDRPDPSAAPAEFEELDTPDESASSIALTDGPQHDLTRVAAYSLRRGAAARPDRALAALLVCERSPRGPPPVVVRFS
jgi:hypothetical protein